MMGPSIKAVEPQFIPDFSTKDDYKKYHRMVMEDFQIVKGYFPLLQITCMPTSQPKEIFITGNLIPVGLLKEYVTPKDIERNSLYILGIYPNFFPEENIYVEDFYKKINWGKIPDEHIHQKWHPKTGRKILCTHHHHGEINEIKQNERTIAVLFNAWKLYIQYKRYLKTGKWTLKELKHGDEGISQLKKMGKYYG